MEWGDAQPGAHGNHEPPRGAGSSPQGRPLADARPCGLKSALQGRFMERGKEALLRSRLGSPFGSLRQLVTTPRLW